MEETNISSKQAQIRTGPGSKYVRDPRFAPLMLTREDELYKAAKLESDGDVKSKGKSPMVEEDEQDDGYAGPELPPDFEADDVPDDEEGRFFGGGMEHKTAQAMQYIDEQDEGEGTVRFSSYRADSY